MRGMGWALFELMAWREWDEFELMGRLDSLGCDGIGCGESIGLDEASH